MRRTPIRIDLAIEIPASQGRVFSYMSDLENNSRWNWAVTATTPLHSGPPRQGSRFLQQRKVPRPGNEVLEITGHRPDSLLEVNSRIDAGEVRYRYQLTPVNPEQTRVWMTLELDSSDQIDRTDLYTARLRAALATNLENLRTVITDADLTTATVPVSTSALAMDVGDVQGESGVPLARTQDAGAPGAVRQGRGRSQRCHLAVLNAANVCGRSTR